MTDILTATPVKEKKKRKQGGGKKWRKISIDHQRKERKEELVAAIQGTQSEIHVAYMGFNQTIDPDLVESYVFEINALQCRHNYLTRQLRACESEWEDG